MHDCEITLPNIESGQVLGHTCDPYLSKINDQGSSVMQALCIYDSENEMEYISLSNFLECMNSSLAV